jgi:dolichol-phosphate mannosyltransferase
MTADQALGKVLVIIPTYNEAPNLRPIVLRLRAAVPEADILVADDNSPDGTGAIADELAAADDQVHVMHRKGKEGLGAAYVAGFRWGLERGYGVLVEHDADGSHQPEQLPAMLEALKNADMVKGSRWVKGGSVVNWPWHRELLSRGGSLWSRVLLGIPVRDVTGGFSAFRADTLRGLGLDQIEAAGYGFQVDLVWRAIKQGYKVVEVPIEFIERELGDSKMDSKIVVEALLLTSRWGFAHRAKQVKEYLGFAKEKVGPEVTRYAEEGKRIAGEVSAKVGPEVHKLARQASDRVAGAGATVVGGARQAAARVKSKLDERRR